MDTIAEQPSGGKRALKILAVVFLVLVLACGGVVTYVAMKWKSWALEVIRGPMVEMIDLADLPEDQKESIKASIHRVADSFENGKITSGQFKAIGEQLAQGPFINLVFLEIVEAEHLGKLTMSDTKKREASLTFDRFERGIVEDKITKGQIDKVIAMVSTKPGDARAKLKDELTESELKTLIAAMKERADQAEIPEEPFQVDFAGQFREAIEAVLGPDPTTSQPAPPD